MFNLMKNKPNLDEDTLNYIWDILWRFNACNDKSNEMKRVQCDERSHIMDILQTLANNENANI